MIIFVTDPKKCVYFIIFVVILQQFDGNVLGPKCMGSNINLSAFWVLFAVLLFGGLFGFVGMIIGVPLFAVIYDICKKLIYYLLEKHGKSGMIPLTGQPELQEIYMGKDGESKTKNTPEEPTSPDSGADKATP
jgi:hypothetical protein